jgi:hypothetical protein
MSLTMIARLSEAWLLDLGPDQLGTEKWSIDPSPSFSSLMNMMASSISTQKHYMAVLEIRHTDTHLLLV